jgi:hypothetical protein
MVGSDLPASVAPNPKSRGLFGNVERLLQLETSCCLSCGGAALVPTHLKLKLFDGFLRFRSVKTVNR